MDLNHILNLALGVIVAGLGWWLKEVNRKMELLQDRISQQAHEALKTYATKQDIEKLEMTIFHRFDKLDDKLDELNKFLNQQNRENN